MRKSFSKIAGTVRQMLKSETFKEDYRMHEKDFTRDRKPGFGEICAMVIRGTKNGLQAGIENSPVFLLSAFIRIFMQLCFSLIFWRFLELDHQEELKIINVSPSKKHTYKINSALAICSLKSNVAELLLASSKRHYYHAFHQIHRSLLQCLSPIRPGRFFPRVSKHPAVIFR